MIFLKDRKIKEGFSFVEIIIAMTIIGIVLTSLFNLQNNIFLSANKYHSQILRIFYLKNLFFDPKINENVLKEKIIKKSIELPSIQIIYELLKPKNKTLTKYKNISLLQAKGTWSGLFQKQEEIMVMLVFNPKIEQEKKK